MRFYSVSFVSLFRSAAVSKFPELTARPGKSSKVFPVFPSFSHFFKAPPYLKNAQGRLEGAWGRKNGFWWGS